MNCVNNSVMIQMKRIYLYRLKCILYFEIHYALDVTKQFNKINVTF